jgi:hypothetical protein
MKLLAVLVLSAMAGCGPHADHPYLPISEVEAMPLPGSEAHAAPQHRPVTQADVDRAIDRLLRRLQELRDMER